MRARIAEIMSRIFSKKYDANVKIIFKERLDEQRRDDRRISRVGVDERDGN